MPRADLRASPGCARPKAFHGAIEFRNSKALFKTKVLFKSFRLVSFSAYLGFIRVGVGVFSGARCRKSPKCGIVNFSPPDASDVYLHFRACNYIRLVKMDM